MNRPHTVREKSTCVTNNSTSVRDVTVRELLGN